MAKVKKKSSYRLIHEVMQYKGLLLISSLGTIVQVALTIYLPVLIGRVVDDVLSPHAKDLVHLLLGQMLVVIVLNTLVQWLNPIIFNQLVYQLMARLRQAVLEKIHSLPLSVLDQQAIGDLVARITTDTEQLTSGLLMFFNQFFVGLLTIVLTIVSMTKLDSLMMAMVIGLSPLSLFIARFIANRSYTYYKAQTTSRGQQVKLLEEAVGQATLIQNFNAQDQFLQDFKVVNAAYADNSQAAIFYSSIVNPATRFVNALIYALLALVGALRIMQGNFTVGQLTTFLNYANQYTKPFNDISSVLSELQSAFACAERLFDILDMESLNETGTAELDGQTIAGQVNFEQVSFSYQSNQPLIKNLNLSVPAGARVAIVGPTGAGKSTLINLLMRFYEVNQGRIKLDGRPITDLSRTALRRQIGMVLQDTWLQSGTIHDNIAFGHPDAKREAVVRAAEAANADFFIRQLPQGYDTYLADAGELLSQGQRQLLAIARIFVQRPKILILDEATSSIDTRTEILIQAAFDKLMKGRTSFIIAHRLSTIQSADLILVMVDGDIIEQGNHQQLMAAKGHYYQMQQTQGAVTV